MSNLSTIGGDTAAGASLGAVAGPWGAAIGGLAGAGLGIFQAVKASHIHPQRPTYTIPQGINNNVAMYQQMADTSRMPGAGISENAIYGNQASLVRQALQSGGSAGDILASLGGIGQQTNNSLNQIAQQGAQYQMAGKEALANANNTQGDYSNQSFSYNQNDPYQLQYMRKMALQGGALGNFDTTAQNLGNAGMTAMMGAGGGYSSGNSSVPASAGGYQYTAPTGQAMPEPSFQG